MLQWMAPDASVHSAPASAAALVLADDLGGPTEARRATARPAANSAVVSGSSMAAEDALADDRELDPNQAEPMLSLVSLAQPV